MAGFGVVGLGPSWLGFSGKAICGELRYGLYRLGLVFLARCV